METQLLEYGLPGIVILALAGALVKLFKLYNETQEKRVVESRESLTTIATSVAAMDRLTETVGALAKDDR